jgi:RNA polymerase sigma factor (sigma-70 family)
MVSEGEVVEANLALVGEVASKVSRRIPTADPEELFADGLVGLLAAVRSCEADAPPPAWVVVRVQRAMMDGLRAARGRRWRGVPASLDRTVGENGDTASDLLVDETADVDELAAARELETRILALEPRRRFVLLARRRGLTDAETGAYLGVSSSRVTELVFDARRKLAA